MKHAVLVLPKLGVLDNVVVKDAHVVYGVERVRLASRVVDAGTSTFQKVRACCLVGILLVITLSRIL